MQESYREWFARWSKEMASESGSGKVPPSTEATYGTAGGPSGGKAGFRRAGRQRARIPDYRSRQVRKL